MTARTGPKGTLSQVGITTSRRASPWATARVHSALRRPFNKLIAALDRGFAAPFAHWTIGTRLAAIVLALAAPLGLLIAAMVWYLAAAAGEAQRASLLYAAHSIAAAADARIDKYIALARGLASSPALLDDNLDAFEAEARLDFVSVADAWVLVADLEGQQLVSLTGLLLQPLPKRNPVAFAAQQQAMAEGDIVVSPMFVEPDLVEWMATIELPIRKEGLPFRALAVAMDLKGFLRLLNVQKMPDKWLGGIVDTQGNMVARIPDREQHIGQPASEGWRRVANQEGVFEFPSLEGDPVVAAAAPIHGGWAAVIAIKQSEVYAQVWRAVRWVSLCGAAIMLASLSFAWRIARGIREPLLQLGKMAPQILRGGTVEIAAALPEVATVAGLLRRAAEDLRYGEQRLQFALDAAEAGLWEANPRSGAFVASDRALALHGLAPGTSMTHEKAMATVHLDDRPLVDAAMAETLTRGTPFRVEMRAPQSDGSLLWLMSRAALQMRPEGPRLVGLVQDITARKDAELRQAFLLRLNDALRPRSEPNEIQAEASRLLGEHLRANRVSYADIDGSDFIIKKCYTKGVAPIVGRYPIASFGEALVAAARRGEKIAVDDVGADPRLTDVERVALRTAEISAFVGVMLIKSGQLLGAFGVQSATPRIWTPTEVEIIGEVAERIWSDGERAKAEAALRESEERFRALVMLSSDWYWEQDENFRFTEFSSGVQQRTGWSPDTRVGKTIWEVPTTGTSEEQWMRHRAQLNRHETFRDFELAGTNDRGETIWISVSGEPKFDETGNFKGYRGTGRNVTARKKAQEALARANAELEQRVAERTADVKREMQRRDGVQQKLAQAQRLEAVGRLAGGLAHDFNNALTAIAANLEIAQLHASDKNEQQALRKAMTALRMSAALNRRFLTMSCRENVVPLLVAVNDRIGNIADVLAHVLGDDILLETRLAPDCWSTLLDPGDLDSSILNLTINARDAMPRGGTLTIETCNVTCGTAAITTDAEPRDFVRVSVRDTGTGMTPDVMARAAEPFFSTKDTRVGTGLGLSSVQEFIKAMNGMLTIDSQVGEGTLISLFLPRAAEAINAPKSPESAEVIPLGDGELVLLVDDDEKVLEATCALIESLGYAVITAGNGSQAVALLEDGEPVQVIISDVVLPGGMSGYDVAFHVLRKRPTIKTVLVSGFHGGQSQRNDPALDAVQLLRKPYTREQLAGALRVALAG